MWKLKLISTETSYGLSGFMHSICESETGFAKPSKPIEGMVLLPKPDTTAVYVDSCG